MKFNIKDKVKLIVPMPYLKTSENMPVKELAKLGQELFADMILVGNLNSIRLQKAQRKMNTSDRVLEYLAGNIATNIRIIDTATGQIKFSSSLRAFLASVPFIIALTPK